MRPPERDLEPTLVDRVFRAIAERLASDPRIPQDSRSAFSETVETVMRQQFRAFFGGDRVRFYVPKSDPAAVADRTLRIVASIQKGERTPDIAGRERVSEDTVRRIRGRLVDRADPP